MKCVGNALGSQHNLPACPDPTRYLVRIAHPEHRDTQWELCEKHAAEVQVPGNLVLSPLETLVRITSL